ncbi:MAG: sulfotransferase family 2 domain-containing protein [Paracoccaceae bacterium]|nr:sulfotransferase family 2 domain-containing protein [Paracoccaceae bacterium]
MTRQAYILPDHKLTIFWTPKAACTTIVHKICLEILEISREELINEPGGMRGWLINNGYWHEGNKAASFTLENNYQSIALIRDPYDRLISAYINKYVRNSSGPIGSFLELEVFAKNFYSEVLKLGKSNGNLVYEGITFAEFSIAVFEAIENRSLAEPKLDSHWNTQIPFSFQNNNFEYDYLFELSNAAGFFSKLAEITRKDLKNEQLNATKYSTDGQKSLINTKSKDLANLKNISKSHFMDSYLEERAREAFNIDYLYLEKNRTTMRRE